MQRKKLFNVDGDDTLINRRMIKGNVTNLFNLNNVKYQWANKLYRLMMENFWIPEKVSLFDDKRAYNELTPAEQNAYDGILSFLVFLDSIQTNNLPNISDYITAPEVNLILAIQTYQEAVHSQSYAYIIESIIPAEKRACIMTAGAMTRFCWSATSILPRFIRILSTSAMTKTLPGC